MASNGSSPGCVLVTGASSGIGRELARIFAAEGYRPVLLARSRDRLEALAQELRTRHGARVTVIPADLSDSAAPGAVFERLDAAGIEVEVLVNAAGLLLEGDLAEGAPDVQIRLLQVNVVALTALTRLFVAPMVQRSHGRILNIASLAAFMPIPSLAIYAASKAYVLSLTEALSEELKGTGVTATALCPGITDTAMVRGSPRAARLAGFAVADAAAVAREGYEACVAGRPVQTPGLSSDIMATVAHYMPRSLVRAVGGAVVRRWF